MLSMDNLNYKGVRTRDAARIPEWARAEHLERVVSQKELWKIARKGR